MTRFKALLIGVPHYESGDFPDISTVRNDLTQLRRTLELTGYDKHQISVFPDLEEERPHVTAAKIDGWLGTAFETAPEDGILFVYFSGHGVSHGGKDYLVPSDIPSLARARAAPQFLVSTDLSQYLGGCKARAIVFAVDACRETLISSKGFSLTAGPAIGRGALDPAHKARIGTIFGCDAEQFCYFSGDLRMSLFTKALISALAPEHPARTLSQVFQGISELMPALLDRYRPGSFQDPVLVLENGRGDIKEVPICAGGSDEWQTTISDSGLWRRVVEDTEAERKAAAKFAADVWHGWQANLATLPDDPWRDADFFRRCVRALDLLIPLDAELSPAEALALLTAPLLAEATHLTGIDALVAHSLRDLAPNVSGDPLRRELEAVHSAHARVWQKAISLAEQRPVDRDALAVWLAHRCAFRQVGLWKLDLPLRLSQQLAGAIEERSGFRAEVAGAVRGLASMLAAGAEDLTVFLNGQAQGDRALAAEVTRTLLRNERINVRGKILAILLGLAGVMAFDPRRLGEVVVDHIGIHDPLDPGELHRAVHEARWSVEGSRTTLALTARCTHPAIHLALREMAEAIQSQLQVVRQWLDNAPEDYGRAILERLPAVVSTSELKPERNDETDRMAYETPLLQFRLDHREIRDLLMGVRLYGDPALAIRELYQNALDACRYRTTRARFLGKEHRGKISFYQGFDDRGREYIECIDNGVGMGRNELVNTFSKGGRRFVNSTDFLWEQAEWLQKDPNLRLWPNSRFGIGVFSYFMIADEIFIETAHVDRLTNAPLETLQVRIASSGSLFRILTAESSGRVGSDGGTLIRLYLRPNMEQGISCVEKLKELLWYAEFDVEASDAGRHRSWPAGKLLPPEEYDWLEQTHGIWWVSGSGMVLSDGIATDLATFGYVANLTAERSATLSVDRRTVEDWDRAWVRDSLTSGTERLAENPKLTFTWLQAFARHEPTVAQTLVREIGRRGLTLRKDEIARGPSASPIHAGIWSADRVYYESSIGDLRNYSLSSMWGISESLIEGNSISRWKVGGVMSDVELQIPDNGHLPGDNNYRFVPKSVEGYPVFEPLDIPAMLKAVNFKASDSYARRLKDEYLALLENSRDFQIQVDELLRRIRRFVIHGATPPPIAADSWAHVASPVEIQITKAVRDGDRSMMVVLAEISYRSRMPLARLVGRANAVLRWQRDPTLDFDPAPDYICGVNDALILAAVMSRDVDDEPNIWVHAFFVLGPTVIASQQLLNALGKPADALMCLADAAIGDGDLAECLTVNSVPGSCPDGWLSGEVTELDILIACGAGLGGPEEIVDQLMPFRSALGISVPPGLAVLTVESITPEALLVLRAVNRHYRRVRSRDSEDDIDEGIGLPLLAWVCAECRLSPETVLGLLGPYRDCIDAIIPDNVLEFPDGPPSSDDAELILEVVNGTHRGANWYHVRRFSEENSIPLDRAVRVMREWRIPLLGGGPEPYTEVELPVELRDSMSSADVAVLSKDADMQIPFRVGRLDPQAILRVACRNGEKVSRTVVRVTSLSEKFPLLIDEFNWGDLFEEPIPLVIRNFMEGYHPRTPGLILIYMAFQNESFLPDVVNKFEPFLIANKWPTIGDDQLSEMNFIPDGVDVLAMLPPSFRIMRSSGDRQHVWDALHVILAAGKLGLSVGNIGRRLARLAPLLGALPSRGSTVAKVQIGEVPVELLDVVPDWRDVVILTPGLDGRRMITDADITDEWIVMAAREVETTTAHVRARLALYAEYCRFTAPTIE